jgi:predicted transcriptional regulator
MDRILSARVDESVANSIGSLARRLHTSKKKIIERAIEMYAAKVNEEQEFDVFQQTCGAWSRKESAEQLVKRSRKAFRDSMRRHQR